MIATYQKFFVTLSLFFTIATFGLGSAQAAPPNDPLGIFPVTDGQVNSIVQAGGIVFIGGSFSKVFPYTGNGVVVSITTGVVDPAFPRVNGSVLTVVSDGTGGWFIGGEFTVVGTISRLCAAHIIKDAATADPNDWTVDTAWNANLSSGCGVNALARSGTTLYLGGGFTTIGGEVRNRIGAVSTSTGAVLSWDPDAKQPVDAIVVDGNTVYVGGRFSSLATNPPGQPSIGGAVREFIAALDASTGLATAWNPGADARVTSLLVEGNTVYVGGSFKFIGGGGSGVSARNNIAAVNANTGEATDWDPNLDGQVLALAKSGNTVYAGGQFNNVVGSGVQRRRLAAINVTSGVATDWNPDASSSVQSIRVVGSTVYVAGTFTTIGGQPRNNVAALNADVNTNMALAWNPNANTTARTIEIVGSTVYIGGEFTSVGGETLRNNFAAFDAATGAVKTNINPDVTGGAVLTMAALGNTLFLGGEFTKVGLEIRNRAAAIDGPSGALLSWNPSANGAVRALAIGNDFTAVYIGGDFTDLNGTPRNHVAALSLSGTGAPFPTWDPNANGTVSSIIAATPSQGDKIYIAGAFTNVDNTARSGLAFLNGKFKASSPWLETWNPVVSGPATPDGILVRTMLLGAPIVCGDTTLNPANPTLRVPLYLGGDFTSIGGQGRNRVAAVRHNGAGALCTWNPGANDTVRTLAQSGNLIFAGGDFTQIGSSERNRLASLDVVTGRALAPIVGAPGGAVAWNPNANASVQALAVVDTPIPGPGKLYAGGKFATIVGSAPSPLPRNNFAVFAFTPLVAASLPISRSVQQSTTATFWALIVNADTGTTAKGVGIAPNDYISPSDFSYQAFSPINQPPNTPVDIPPGVAETFLVAITPSATLAPSLVPFIFEGANTNAAPQFNAVNTLLFSSSTTATIDPIAQPVTAAGGGIVDIPGATGTSFIAVATTNVGVGGTVTVEANTGNVNLPVTLTICETNPNTGVCINPTTPAPSTTLTMVAGGTNTFLVTVKGNGTIAFDPALNRILINFHDGGTITGPVRGGTSVAARTVQP